MYYFGIRHLYRHLGVESERVTDETKWLWLAHYTMPSFMLRRLWYASIVSTFSAFFFLGGLSTISGMTFIGPKSFSCLGFAMIASSWKLLDVP